MSRDIPVTYEGTRIGTARIRGDAPWTDMTEITAVITDTRFANWLTGPILSSMSFSSDEVVVLPVEPSPLDVKQAVEVTVTARLR